MRNFSQWLISAVLLMTPTYASACSVCFAGDPSEKANVALRAAILVLIAILAVLLAIFITFFVSVARRSGLSMEDSG